MDWQVLFTHFRSLYDVGLCVGSGRERTTDGTSYRRGLRD